MRQVFVFSQWDIEVLKRHHSLYITKKIESKTNYGGSLEDVDNFVNSSDFEKIVEADLDNQIEENRRSIWRLRSELLEAEKKSVSLNFRLHEFKKSKSVMEYFNGLINKYNKE